MDLNQLIPEIVCRALLFLLGAYAVVALSWQWIRELSFYQRNQWDFYLDIEPVSSNWAWPNIRSYTLKSVTNSQRVKIYYPLFVFIRL
jgi:hypothetical protein